MRVVFLEDVEGVAQGGDVKEVKNGFARNYLIPKSLAVPATHNALQRVQGLTVQSEKDRVKMLSDMRELATHLEGVRVAVEPGSVIAEDPCGVGGEVQGRSGRSLG